MNQGRAGLEQVIEQYEQQRAEAMRIKQEAEIVLPFLRAAIEELESNGGQAAEGTAPAVQQPVARPRQSEPRAERRNGASVFGIGAEESEAAETDEAEEVEEVEEAPRASHKGFGRTSIASLIDEAGKSKKTG